MEITTTQFKHCDLVKASGRIDSSTAPRLDGKLQQSWMMDAIKLYLTWKKSNICQVPACVCW
jgi:hypothetical protein